MKEIIRFENVVKMYDNRRALSGVSLCISEKAWAMVCGPPGSGKMTLMRLIAGMEAPSAGKVFVLDQAVHEMDAGNSAVFRSQNIGIVRRQAGFMERLSVIDNVSLPLAVQGMPMPTRKQKAKELLKALGISYIAHAHPFQISAYEALTVSVARALIIQPKILMLYEVTADLSEGETEKFAGLMNVILQYGDYTVLSFSVNPNNTWRKDRTILLDHGKIQEERS